MKKMDIIPEVIGINKNTARLFFLLLIIFFSCRNQNANHISDSYIRDLIKLQHERKFNEAEKIVDSLINTDKDNDKWYFQKGIIENRMDSLQLSVRCFQIAYKLNYRRQDCIQFMKFSQTLLDIKMKYDSIRPRNKKLVHNKKDSVLH